MKHQKLRIVMWSVCILGLAGCGATKPMKVTTPRLDPCPMPEGYKMGPAIEVAEQTLTTCPQQLDSVFMKLLEIAKHSPHKQNGVLIQDLLKRLIKENKVSQTYTKTLYQRYFSRKFVSLPDIKVYNLSGEMTPIKKALREELGLKKIGMVECCNDRESYEEALKEYARAISFMENLALNEAYLKEG